MSSIFLEMTNAMECLSISIGTSNEDSTKVRCIEGYQNRIYPKLLYLSIMKLRKREYNTHVIQ